MSSFWIDRPTLVTGATGLVGGWLVQQLLAMEADVVCLVRDWVPQSELVRSRAIDACKVVRGDVRDVLLMERTLAEYEIATVFHLAAQTMVPVANRSPLSTFETNVGGTWSLLEACRRVPGARQIVLASSDKAYGVQDALPYEETMALRGQYPYDVSKACADLIGQSFAATYGLSVGITRCGNLFGGGDLNWNRVVPGTIRSILRHERPAIRSDGHATRDYFYVEDAVAAYLLLAERLAACPQLRGAAFNFSLEQPLSVLQLVRMTATIMGSDLEPRVLNEANNEIPDQRLKAARARTQLGWQPLFSLEEGLERTVRWYKELLGVAA